MKLIIGMNKHLEYMGLIRNIKSWLKPEKKPVVDNQKPNELLLKLQKDRQFEFSAQKDGGSPPRQFRRF